jgi:hypothetical protein
MSKRKAVLEKQLSSISLHGKAVEGPKKVPPPLPPPQSPPKLRKLHVFPPPAPTPAPGKLKINVIRKGLSSELQAFSLQIFIKYLSLPALLNTNHCIHFQIVTEIISKISTDGKRL